MTAYLTNGTLAPSTGSTEVKALREDFTEVKFTDDGFEADYAFDRQAHVKTLAANLDQMRQVGQLLDVKLISADNKPFGFHRF